MPPTTQLNNLFGCLFIFVYFYFSVRLGALNYHFLTAVEGIVESCVSRWGIKMNCHQVLKYLPDAPAFSCSMCRESFLLFCDFDVASYCGWGSGHNILDSCKLWHSLRLQGCLVPLMTEWRKPKLLTSGFFNVTEFHSHSDHASRCVGVEYFLSLYICGPCSSLAVVQYIVYVSFL